MQWIDSIVTRSVILLSVVLLIILVAVVAVATYSSNGSLLNVNDDVCIEN